MSVNISEKDIVLGLLPFFHIYGMIVVTHASLRSGATLVTLPSFEPVSFLETIQNHHVTWAPLVPPLVNFLAKHPMVDDYDLSGLLSAFSGNFLA